MNLIIKTILLSTLAYFAPIYAIIYLVFILVGVDFITGLYLSIKDKKKIQSRKLKRTIIKLTAYLLALIITFLFECIILGSGILVTKIIGGYISLTEIASIFENLGKIINKNSLYIVLYDTLKTYFNINKKIINNIDTEKD